MCDKTRMWLLQAAVEKHRGREETQEATARLVAANETFFFSAVQKPVSCRADVRQNQEVAPAGLL